MRPADPGRYGRVITRGDERGQRIVEWADADEAERAEGLCNAGVLCAAAADFSRWLHAVEPSPAKGEYYLTDCVALAVAEGKRVVAVEAPEAELRGVNSRAELADAEATVQRWLREAAMEGGATLTAPETVWLSWDTQSGAGRDRGPARRVRPRRLGRVRRRNPGLQPPRGLPVGPGALIGPYARLRPGTVVGRTRPCRQLRRAEGDAARRRRQGQPPQLPRRQRDRRRHQHRRRHDHLQL